MPSAGSSERGSPGNANVIALGSAAVLVEPPVAEPSGATRSATSTKVARRAIFAIDSSLSLLRAGVRPFNDPSQSAISDHLDVASRDTVDDRSGRASEEYYDHRREVRDEEGNRATWGEHVTDEEYGEAPPID